MKNFWSRRDFLFQSGGGISGLALAYLLNQDGLLGRATGRRLRREGRGLQSVRAEEAALRSARQTRDLAVHERRRQPHRHLRSQARARRNMPGSR